jgi:capsular polysaccharide biosynthesis protein
MSEAGTLATLSDPMLVEEKNAINLKFSRNAWLFIGGTSILVGILSMLFTFTLPQQYLVTRQMLVFAGANPNDNDTLVQSLQVVMGSKGFATEIKADIGLDIPVEQVQSMVSVNRPAASALLEAQVTSADQDTAELVSAQIVPTLRRVIEADQRNLPPEQRLRGPIVQELFTRPIKELVFVPPWMGFMGGAVLGFIGSFMVVALRQYRKPVISSARDVGEALDLPVLARLPAVGDGRNANPQDAVLGMLSAIERLGARGPIHRLVVVGPESDLERSKLILALGCAVARNFDQPVALVDGDLENAQLTKLIGASDEPGLAECLTGELRADQTLLRLENGHTPALLSGMVPPSGMIRVMPAGLNRGGSLLRMRSNLHQVLGALSGKYVVVVDGPQVPGPVPSSQLLSLADATIVVVTEGSTSVRDARFTGEALRSSTNNPVGAIVLKK